MKKIFLVEDDDTMRSLLKTLLELECFEVIAANPDQNPIDSLIIEKPDVLLLDVHLKNLNGINILKSIRQTKEIESMLVLMTSGEDLEERCMFQGANGFLLKPYMPDELINWIKKNTSTTSRIPGDI